MTNIEQKAREGAELIVGKIGKLLSNRYTNTAKVACGIIAQELGPALQSAVAEEREECRRYIHEHESADGCTDGHGGIFETCQFASCIDLRARGQKETA